LTLNVLLSFAQFEREVTGERIRDKIAASKKKGMFEPSNFLLATTGCRGHQSEGVCLNNLRDHHDGAIRFTPRHMAQPP
jgi:hypothetical protein